jgi:hypothetical protein
LKRKDTHAIFVALYRMLLVSVMLKRSKIAHRGTSHPYPKMILANLCILAHWKQVDFIGYKMLDTNVAIFNEELGEMTFSMLARSVLGDHTDTNIDHVNDLYALLPVCKSVKDDILDDVSSTTSISWRHKIDPQGSEVNAVAHFFQQKISQLNRLRFTTYDGSPACYKSRTAAVACLTSAVTPTVYLPDVLDLLPAMFDEISESVHGSFLGPFTNIWPPPPAVHAHEGSEEETDYSSAGEVPAVPVGGVIVQWGADWDGCAVGKFSVSRVVWQGGQFGITVHKIRRIEEKDIHNDGNVYHSFQGKEYSCTKDAWNINCVGTGKWYVRPGSSVANDTVLSYDVIAYFSALAPGGKLPSDVSVDIRQQHQREPVFSVI